MNYKPFCRPAPRLILLFILALIFTCCTDEKSKGRNQPTVMKETELKSVEVISTGGELGFYAHLSIDTDSTHYKQTVAANPADNSEYHKQTDLQDWKNLATKVDLTTFKAAKEGKSVQPVDGIDTKVVIVSNTDTISKMNAYNNSVWRDVVEQLYHRQE